MPMPDLPRSPDVTPKTIVLALMAIIAIFLVGVALPAYATWRGTHDGGWTAMAGVGGFVISWMAAFLIGIAVDVRHGRYQVTTRSGGSRDT